MRPNKLQVPEHVLHNLNFHYAAIAEIQQAYGFSPKGTVLAWYPYGDYKLIVESDGIGGASLMLVDNYPLDGYDCQYRHGFPDEYSAAKAAEWIDDLLHCTSSLMTMASFFGLLAKGRKPWEEASSVETWHDRHDERGEKRPDSFCP